MTDRVLKIFSQSITSSGVDQRILNITNWDFADNMTVFLRCVVNKMDFGTIVYQVVNHSGLIKYMDLTNLKCYYLV